MYKRAKQYTLDRPTLRRIAGVLLIVGGVLGLIMPIMPGIIFLVLGLELFGIRLLFVDRVVERVRGKKKEVLESTPTIVATEPQPAE